MIFNSIDFAIFLPAVFILYWFVTNRELKLQNILITGASYIFYGWWNWKFLTLILFSTVIDYLVGLKLQKTCNQSKRKVLLWVSIFVNLGLLGIFKYYNFFLNEFIRAYTFFGSEIQFHSLKIILPVGISFYTFQTLSYTIDVYRKNLVPTKDFIAFSAFVSFFPQLVAGPIERATNLLPQFYKKRFFNYKNAEDGVSQIIWGLFKKIVIADNCAVYANNIFNNYTDYSGGILYLGAFFFAFQIYGDFSGYSDIAIGTSKLFGFELKDNFKYPYFSRDIAEFWRRWHISLSSWFRDYLYIPIGGSKGTLLQKIRNIFIIFIISGLWHGANWTFIAWGAVNALYFLPLFLLKTNRNNIGIVAHGKLLPSIKEFINMCSTFSLTLIAWIFFRSDTLGHSINYLVKLLVGLLNKHTYIQTLKYLHSKISLPILILLILFLLIEWIGREKKYAIAYFNEKLSGILRWFLFYLIILTIFLFAGKEQQFIYFQF